MATDLVQRCSARLADAEDAVLHRLFCYLKATPSLGLTYWGNPRDASCLFVMLFADSDHCGEVVDTKNTTGLQCVAKGLRTWAPLEWGSKRHGATSRNTTEAEITATSDATFRVGVPIQSFLERLLWRAVLLVAM